ncbi:hypothetical protein B9Z39_03415 [Limnohabitans sp. JirII-29]|uniref:glycosyltransferase family 9 protein n=1 Tax=Limnohabitans sp. JirII-29 TaxID=1835756 RepID=UPI000D38676D|nr:glycosyltransferase family 9 protein [Limnohabitans sp. JirII-29]PUE29134.1 hypothetical protein B9Z39_03415 [Limnohabitans sp. JirII-29]
MKLRKALYFYVILIRAIVQAWVKCPREAKALVSELWRVYQTQSYDAFIHFVLKRVLVHQYRLKVKIKLGRPSPTIFRKFYEEINGDEALCGDTAVKARQQPKYLIIRDGAMGDVLMLTPVVRALYLRHEGDIAIDIATQARAVFDHNPYVRAVLDPKTLSRGIHTYDAVLDLNEVYERSPQAHPVNVYGKFVLGVGAFDKKLELHATQEDAHVIDGVVAKIGGPYVVVHHFRHEWPNREIDPKVWGGLLDGFAQQKNFKVIYVGVDRDHAHIKGPGFEDHRGRYSIQQLSLLIARSEGFLGGDSGPSHIAATTDAPMCIFYTCAHHEARMPLRQTGRFLPITPRIDCYGCLTRNPVPRPGYFCQRGDNACVGAFDVGDVTHRILKFFEGRP